MAWIVEWTHAAYNSVNIRLWSDEEYALVAACSLIMIRVKDDWDRSDKDWQECGLKISDACAAGNWREAIRLFNDWEGDGDFDNMRHVRVYERKNEMNLPAVPLLRGSHPTINPPAPVQPKPFKAMYPGAVCRGPCKTVSTDAYADQPDGTYCCYQCKMFSQVFGKKVP